MPCVGAIGTPNTIPLEFHRVLNPELTVDLTQLIADSNAASTVWSRCKSATYVAVIAAAVSAVALAYFFASPIHLIWAASPVMYSFEGVFKNMIPLLSRTEAAENEHAQEMTLVLEEERALNERVTNWTHIEQEYEARNIVVTRARDVCTYMMPERPHTIVLRGLAIDAVIRAQLHKATHIAATKTQEVATLRAAFLQECHRLEPWEQQEQLENIERVVQEQFQAERQVIDYKIRSAYIRTALTRPDDTRSSLKYGTITLNQREESVIQESILGTTIAFTAPRADGAAENFSREWLLHHPVRDIAERIFACERSA